MRTIYFTALILSLCFYSCQVHDSISPPPPSVSDTLCYKDSISLYVPYTGYINPGTDTIYTVMDYKKLNKNNVNLSFHLQTDSNVAVDSVRQYIGFHFITSSNPFLYSKSIELDFKVYDSTCNFSINLNTSDSIKMNFSLSLIGFVGKVSHEQSFIKIKNILLK
ncbi:MAG: hypothetical protein EHM58_03100 [Ignavibacteriae bacterium]|nr:MAG: hypothetical protein EHM58_03100 [Ignavibacteriota bacterium]